MEAVLLNNHKYLLLLNLPVHVFISNIYVLTILQIDLMTLTL